MKSKSDEDQLEAWVQSKITKASDYIAKVADYLEYNPDVAEQSYTSEILNMTAKNFYQNLKTKLR